MPPKRVLTPLDVLRVANELLRDDLIVQPIGDLSETRVRALAREWVRAGLARRRSTGPSRMVCARSKGFSWYVATPAGRTHFQALWQSLPRTTPEEAQAADSLASFAIHDVKK
jgi:hypothetical protein